MRFIEVKKDTLAEKRIKKGLTLKTLAEKAGSALCDREQVGEWVQEC